MRNRCCNLDWLEVHAYEPIGEPHDPAFYSKAGWVVHERAYGTRVYRQMFTLEGRDGYPFLEIRRDPASQGLNGIHQPNESHIRLVNRSCYLDNAADLLSQFLRSYGYQKVRISRVDVCLDFVRFDHNTDPRVFIERYFNRRYAKVNQTNIHAHGSDTWDGQKWNSLSWGSPASDIGTKMYNKTLELYDPKSDSFGKPYIRQAWFQCGMIDDLHRVTLKGERVHVWRIEFSIRSSVKNWFVIEVDGKYKKYQSVPNTLEVYNSREKIITIFASLTRHYFRFKKVVEGQRKDRCPDKILFDWQDEQCVYKVGRDEKLLGDGTQYQAPYERLITRLRELQQRSNAHTIYAACETIISFLERECLRKDLHNPYSHNELLALQQAIAQKIDNPSADVAILLKEIARSLKLNDRTTPVF